jgi:hypothetical protein
MNNVKIAVHTGTLNFLYLAAFLVEGLQSPANGPIGLYSNEAKDKKVSLTGHSHADWNHIDFRIRRRASE